MAKDFNIEKISGTAKVIDSGQTYNLYGEFARAAGYPEATKDKRRTQLYNGEPVELLAKGDHESGYSDKLYVVADRDGLKAVIGVEGLAFTDIEDPPPQTSIAELQAQIDVLQAEVAELKRGVTVTIGGKNAGKMAAPAESPQQVRDRIVEQAKEDVTALVARGRDAYAYGDVGEGSYTYCYRFYAASFQVNRDKKAVTALIKTTDGAGMEFGNPQVGIAKCSLDDCFNADIGKAIALRRALGLDVPDDYLNAPQPEEVRVGDYVSLGDPFTRELVSDTDHNSNRHIIGISCAELWHGKGRCSIIDDSREEVSG